jgi:hypothetical protein
MEYKRSLQSKDTLPKRDIASDAPTSLPASPHPLQKLISPNSNSRLQRVYQQQVISQLGGTIGNTALQRLLIQREDAGTTSTATPTAATATPAATPTADAEAKPPAPAVKHYSLKDSSIVLTATVETKIGEIADKYYDKNKKDLVVTSGTRTAAEQASAMYTKLEGGDTLSVYANKTAVADIKKAYDDAKTAKKSKDEIIAAMKDVIQGQVDKKIYISDHLKEGAVDIRNNDMSADDKKKFVEASKEAGITPLEETIPPHFHLEIN